MSNIVVECQEEFSRLICSCIAKVMLDYIRLSVMRTWTNMNSCCIYVIWYVLWYMLCAAANHMLVCTAARGCFSPEQDLPQDSTLPVEPGPSYHLVAKIYVCQLFGVIAKYLKILIEYLKVHTLKKENS